MFASHAARALILSLVPMILGATILASRRARAATIEVGPEPGQMSTIQSAIDIVQPGDTVLIHDGMYRETVQVTISGTADQPITIEAAAGARPVITGADLIPADQWQPVAGTSIWSYSPWTYQAPSRTLGDPPHTYITEQVIEDGSLLASADSMAAMTPGAFFADPNIDQALYVWPAASDFPSAHTIEVSVRPLLMAVTGNYVVVSGLIFRYGSNNAQQPAFSVAGESDIAEDCTIELTGGEGADIAGAGNIFRRIVSRDNGQMGMAGHGTDNLIVDSSLLNNNTMDFPKGWEAGGIKVAATRRFHIIHSVAQQNNGPGFWFDIDNENGSIENSYAGGNDGPGIQIEISSDMSVSNNLCVRNGLTDEPGSWNYAGILIAESMRIAVEHNTTVENLTGIEVRQQGIRELMPDPNGPVLRYYSDRLVFANNISAFNQNWQFALFGDNPFFGGADSVSPGDMQLLDPDEREWQMNQNDYYAPGHRGLILWGAPWRPLHKQFHQLKPFRRAHHLDFTSIVANPNFINLKTDDFGLKPHSPARKIDAGPADPLPSP